MNPERHVKIFKNGRNQAVRIPREFEFQARMRSCERKASGLSIEPTPLQIPTGCVGDAHAAA
jgi:antitoxin VapB